METGGEALMASLAATLLLPLVLQVFPLVAKLMDKVFGPKTGGQKTTTGVEIADALMAGFKALLGPAVGLPATTETPGLLQSAVEELNKQGLLKGHATVVDPKEITGVLVVLGEGTFVPLIAKAI